MGAPDDQNIISLATLKASLRPRPQGYIAAITPAAGGSGYTSAPTVTITDSGGPGRGATAIAILTGDAVTSINMVSRGEAYMNPHAALSGGGGSGATAIVELSEDAALQQAITDASVAVLDQANIARFFDDGQPIVEPRIGNASDQMVLTHWPVTSITSVVIGGTVVPASDGVASGFWLDTTSNSVRLIGFRFWAGIRVTITYHAGESTSTLSSRAREIGRAVLATAMLWYKRSPYEHLRSENAPQGMGTNISLQIDAFPPIAVRIIKQQTRVTSPV